MATIVATAGSATANSYATTDDADTYFDERLQSSAWTGETDADVQKRALIEATRRIDQETFEGERSTTGQALKWPRIGAADEDGNEYDSDEIPTIVIHATYELALALLNSNADSTDLLADSGLEGFKRVKVGPLEVEPRHAQDAGELPDNVHRLLKPVLQTTGSTADLLRA